MNSWIYGFRCVLKPDEAFTGVSVRVSNAPFWFLSHEAMLSDWRKDKQLSTETHHTTSVCMVNPWEP